MFASMAGLALALQLVTTTDVRTENVPPIQEIRDRATPRRTTSDRYYPLEYGGGRRPVPCGHGADADIRDGLCYPNGVVPRQYQQGRPGYHVRRNGYYEMR
jgi:hypothetical protein